MASTYLSLHYHLVFATKNREAIIAPEWRSRMHEYLGGIISGLGGFSQGVGGVADHVHLLVGLKATHCLADVMRELKKASSAWVHEQIGVRTFAWQEGYAAFTVSAPGRRFSSTSRIKRNIIVRAHPETNYSTCWPRPELNTIPDISSNGVGYWRCDPSGVVELVRS